MGEPGHMSALALFALAFGSALIGAALVLVFLPRIMAYALARYTHPERMAICDQAEAYAIARVLRPARPRRRWVGCQHGKHLSGGRS